ncbi:MAG TPA: hypothetical protein VJ932_11465 [Alkalispirochaeta sp.]|nr:hypothetical protein [Alkalispirochaeta sp.]
MSLDYLDPFRPIDPPRERRVSERPSEVDRDREREPVQEEPPQDQEVEREDSQRGNSIDEYA